MQGRADIAGFIQAFSGSHRHVLSYLVEEVLDRCPEDTLDFLLQTSILDRLAWHSRGAGRVGTTGAGEHGRVATTVEKQQARRGRAEWSRDSLRAP